MESKRENEERKIFLEGFGWIEIVDKPFWNNSSELPRFIKTLQSKFQIDFILSDWSFKYVNIRIDSRSGNFLIKSGDETSKYLKI